MTRNLTIRTLPVFAAIGAFSSAALGQDLSFNTPNTQGATFQSQVVVSKVVDDTYFSLVAHYFGYGGIQQNSGGSTARVGIFSIWDQGSEEASTVDYNHNLSVKTVGRFGGEGTGVQFLFNYAWITGRGYRCAFRNYVEPDGAHMRFGCFFYDPTVGSWNWCCTHRANTTGGYPNYLYGFNENYGGISGNRQATVSNTWWCDTTGIWTDLTSGSTSNVPDGPNDFGQVLTSSSGFEYNSSPSISTYTAPGNVSYTPLPSEAPLYIPYLISCGNATSAGGSTNGSNTWEPDAYWTAGDWNYTYNDPTTVNTSHVTGAAPQKVYQNIRGGDNFTYNLFGLKHNTNYTVRLHFCENYDTTGQRLQNVYINGTQS